MITAHIHLRLLISPFFSCCFSQTNILFLWMLLVAAGQTVAGQLIGPKQVYPERRLWKAAFTSHHTPVLHSFSRCNILPIRLHNIALSPYSDNKEFCMLNSWHLIKAHLIISLMADDWKTFWNEAMNLNNSRGYMTHHVTVSLSFILAFNKWLSKENSETRICQGRIHSDLCLQRLMCPVGAQSKFILLFKTNLFTQ